MNRLCIALLAGTIVAFNCATSLATPIYHLTPLGDLPGYTGSHAMAISSDGRITGFSYNPSTGIGGNQDFYWTSAGGMVPVGQPINYLVYRGFGVNANGQVVSVDAATQAFVWTSSSGLKELGTLGGNYGLAYSIDDAGQIVGGAGISPSSSGNFHAFLWTKSGGMQDLGSLPGVPSSRAVSISANGEFVAGEGDTASQIPIKAILWTNGGGMVDMGNLPGAAVSQPAAVNSLGQVVGGTRTSMNQDYHAFLWSQGIGWKDLGLLPGATTSYAASINDRGQVVGSSGQIGDGNCFLWTAAGGMQDLASLVDSSITGWKLFDAQAINNAGQIVGFGHDPSNNNTAYLLTPINSIPEPSSATISVIGILAFAATQAVARHRRNYPLVG